MVASSRTRRAAIARKPVELSDIEEQRQEEGASRQLLHAFASADSYGLLILLILGTYALAVSTRGRGPRAPYCSRRSGPWSWRSERRRRDGGPVAATVVLVVAGIGAVVKCSRGGEALEVFGRLAGGLLYFIAPFSIARHIAIRTMVDRETMLGAVAAYLCIGIAFALIYHAIGGIQASPFFGHR